MRPTARPSWPRTRRPSRSSTRHSVFFSATTSSGNFRDYPLLQPVFPYTRTCSLPRQVDMDIDPAAHEMLEQDTWRTGLPAGLELRPQPLGEVAEAMMNPA